MSKKRDLKEFVKKNKDNFICIPLTEGKVEVDSNKFARQIYVDESGMQYSADLNCSKIGKNNNKFYKIQIHRLMGFKYILYVRYGRVGAPGNILEKKYVSISLCIKEYVKLFKQKQTKGYIALKIQLSDPN